MRRRAGLAARLHLLGSIAALSAVALPSAARCAAAQAVVASAAARPAQAEPPAMSEEEIRNLKSLYDGLPPEEQAEMRAMYESMGIDLDALFRGLESGPGADAAPVAPAQSLLKLVQQKNFKRTPQTVLAARTALGLTTSPHPASDAPPAQLAEWLHREVMAGEWGELAWFLSERAGTDAAEIYAHVLQSTNQEDPLLLPEEVLAMADAAPADPTEWQIDVLAQLLRTAARKTSTGPMLAQLRAGTRLFGSEGDDRRRRTAELLMKAEMPIEAYDYLPPIDAARAAGDARVILGHGLYHEGRATAARVANAEVEQRSAFALFAEVTLIEGADAALRTVAMRKAMSMLPDIPESTATPWLDEVFRREAIAPAALEIIALDAMTLADRKLDEGQRARAILTMKTAVQTLLSSERVDRQALRVPLRMLTTGLVTEAEKALAAKPDRRGGTAPETAMLLRALPDERWLDTIEPSLAVRAYRAFIGVATVADETELALAILEQGVRRHPGQAEPLATEFLGQWTKRLRPTAESDQEAAIMAAFIYFGGSNAVPAAPLTRGRQARNLELLARVLALLEETGVDPRGLPNVVDSFRACHSRAEAFSAADIEHVLGPIESLPAPTAATLAAAMREGLSGDWRNREIQQRWGMRRNASEIAEVVAEGYEVALRLIERAIAEEPESWSYAVTRAALAFDRLEHRRAQAGEDFAEYDQLRRQSFDAFADAAARYAAAAAGGGVAFSIDVHLAWFAAAVGATQLNQLSRDNILYEGSERDTQVTRIHDALHAMEPALVDQHVGLFVQSIVGALPQVNPEVKPRLVRHALRVAGDHPLAAPLERINGVYDDLLENEIALRMTVDGADRVGAGRPFGAVVALRYTNAVDRETDGFAKYLRNQVWVNFGMMGRLVDYRSRFEQAIQRALEESFEIESIAFFDPLFPSREVHEAGEAGWQEKPMAYLVLSARDPSLERIPPVQMDLDFIDSTGPVILAIESNSPAIDASAAPPPRPARELTVTQTFDARALRDDADGAVVLEVHARGRGVVPELDDLLAGVEDALEGYAIVKDGIEAHPINVVEEGREVESPFAFNMKDEELEEKKILGPDPDGVYRADLERSWTIRYERTAAAAGADFRLPALREGVEATLVSQRFDDLDLVPVTATTVPIRGGGLPRLAIAGLGLAAACAIAAVVILARVRRPAARASSLDALRPVRDTPLGAIAALQRIDREYGERLGAARRSELAADIAALEHRFFGRGVASEIAANGDLRSAVDRWITAVASS
jgi:hypothetical protein